jgi:dynein assembly factor 3
MSERERVEIFLDLYGNICIRDKTMAYLEGVQQELIQFITEDRRCKSPLKEIIDLTHLKYKERDEIEEIFGTWTSKVEFDIEKHRD